MFVPKPPVKLEGHCSVLHDNTLYTYSANGFASIPLERNATWSKLALGEPVFDAACVTGGVEGDETQTALYVVGGTSKSSSKPGLQRYSFKDKTWKTIQSTGSVTSNLTGHSAVYLKAAAAVLVYGGDPKTGAASASTFQLGTFQPYSVLASTGEKASPATSPLLLPWTDNEAVLVGGDTTPKGVHLFNPTQGWRNTKMSIPKELPQGATSAIHRLDGNKILEIFDMSVSPNTVTSTVLSKSNGNKAQKTASRKRKRDTPITGYPQYDGALASSTKRQDYSLAQGDGSLVVISSDSPTDSLAIFNQSSNSWVNTTKLFYGDMSEQEILATTTSLDPTATPTDSTFTASESDSGSGGGDSGTNTRTIIGATLGSLLGVAAILIFILFLIKLKKDRRQRAQSADIDKDRLSFQDQGVEPLTRSAYPMAKTPAPLAASSVDSLAIFSGRTGDEKSPRPAGALPSYIQRPGIPKSSPLTTIVSSGDVTATSEYSRDDKAIEAGESIPAGRPGDRRTNEGWSKYFQDNNATNLVGMQPQPHGEPGSRSTLWPVGGDSGVPPLNFSFLDRPKPLGRVVSGSPTTEHASSSIKDGRHIAIPDGQSAQISSADSVSLHSEDNDFDRRLAPQESHWQSQSWIGRPPSSNYSRSFYNNQSNRDLPSTTAQPANQYRKHDSARTNTRGSSILIPDGEPMPRTNINSDMSWLNLQSEAR